MDYFTAVFIKMGRWHNRFTIILKIIAKISMIAKLLLYLP